MDILKLVSIARLARGPQVEYRILEDRHGMPYRFAEVPIIGQISTIETEVKNAGQVRGTLVLAV